VQDQIEAAGATFIAISPNTPEKSKELIAARKLTFPMLRDERNELAGKFNRLNRLPEDLRQIYLNFGIDLEESNGEPSWTLPVPGTYVIDKGGIIRYASADADYTRRPEPEETLKALKTLAS
jgi:peroxiredoxin